MRVCRDVEILEDTHNELAVLSDVHVQVGEELTLSISSAAGESQLRVRVTKAEPHVANGAVLHRLRLIILNPTAPTE